MKAYQRDLLSYAIDIGALAFGDYVLKSGRHSPYFFNAGHFASGLRLTRLGTAYAHCILDSRLDFEVLFGPAYKGIPLAAATSMQLAQLRGHDLGFAYNRKEVKDHGEGGWLVGDPLRGRVLIIDDVITAGTSVREAVDLIRHAGAEPAGVVIALDRQERGAGEISAVAEVMALFDLPVISILSLDTLIEYVARRPGWDQHGERMQDYRLRYGVVPS